MADTGHELLILGAIHDWRFLVLLLLGGPLLLEGGFFRRLLFSAWLCASEKGRFTALGHTQPVIRERHVNMLPRFLAAHEARRLSGAGRQHVDGLTHRAHIPEIDLQQPLACLVLGAIWFDKVYHRALPCIRLEALVLLAMNRVARRICQFNIRHIQLARNEPIIKRHDSKGPHDGDFLLWGHLERALRSQGVRVGSEEPVRRCFATDVKLLGHEQIVDRSVPNAESLERKPSTHEHDQQG